MCAGSEANIRGKLVTVNMGYNGGEIEFEDGIKFTDKSTPEERQAVAKYMNKYRKEEIINLILDIVEEAYEG